MIDAKDYLDEPLPDIYSPGSEEEMILTLKQTYDCWKETPGAIDIIGLCMAELDDFEDDNDSDENEDELDEDNNYCDEDQDESDENSS